MRARTFAAAAMLVLLVPGAAAAQDLDGYVSVMLDVVPNEDAAELRGRVFAERRVDVGDHVRLTAAGFAEGLAGKRGEFGFGTAGLLRPQELHAEFSWRVADLRVGLSRVVWGRLDEFLPTDVINPLDLTRFFLEGRAEARMPVAMVRGRFLPSDRFSIEGIYLPVFRRGRFDQLDERSSPFNPVPAAIVTANEPARTWRNAQGGARMNATTGRVDWSVDVFRGFDAFPTYDLDGAFVVERFPRYTMIGGDVETVYGAWGLRGEAAIRNDRVEAGVGVDRTAGDYRMATSVIVAHREASGLAPEDTDTMLVGSVDRSFSRETRRVRSLAVYNPHDDSVFVRVIASFSLRDNVAFEASGGLFAGSGADAISQLRTRDYAYAQLKVFF